MPEFDDFYVENYAHVVRLLLGLTGAVETAEELAQEAMISTFRNWDRVRHHDRPDLWTRRVAINRAVSRHRRLVTELGALARLRGERHPPNALADEDGPIWSAVRSLPRRQAVAMCLWAIGGYTNREIGSILGCSEETARTHLRRARGTLASRLEEA